MHTIAEWWMWLIFFSVVSTALFLDFFIFGGKDAHKISTKEAATWTCVWILLSLLFNLLIYFHLGQTPAIEFFTGYLLEKSLSVDNIFVFLVIFSYFSVPNEYQHRILLYGVLGAIVLRFILIIFGIYLINQFEWILYLFGAFLLYSGIKMILLANKESGISDNFIIQFVQKHFRMTKTFHKEKFFVRQNKLLYITPLFLVLILVEASDLVFAVDSIPAIFAITRDPFIVFTSNIFAILGLRSLYFLLENIASRFRFLKYGIAFLLTFIGFKMLISHWIKIPTLTTLSIIATALTLSVLFSLLIREKNRANDG